MNSWTILACGIGVIGGMALIVLLVAAIAAPVNTARDKRRHQAATAHTDAITAELVAQIRDGARAADTVGGDPVKMAAAAHACAVRIHGHLAWAGSPSAELAQRLLTHTSLLPGAGDRAPSGIPLPTALTDAVTLRMLLHRIGGYRAQLAGGVLAEVVRALPDWKCIDFDPLTEHDPQPLHIAQAEWIRIAKANGIPGWQRAQIPAGEATIPANLLVTPPRNR